MKCKIPFVITCFAFLSFASAQEFIPDESFELAIDGTCINPKNGFETTNFWYSIQGTPDLFSSNCPLPVSSEIFWTDGSQAADGANFAGLRCRVNANQTYVSEGLATILSQPLEVDKAYQIQVQVRSKGFYQGFPNDVISCPLKPEKALEIYLHTDSILVQNDFSNGTSQTNTSLALSLRSDQLNTDEISEDWTAAGDCFVASEPFNYLAISMPIGNFGTFPACAADDTQGTFYSFYFEIDEVKIIPLPETIDTVVFTKNGEAIQVDLPSLFGLEFLDDVSYFWQDGTEGSLRTLDKEGFYDITAITKCGNINLSLEVRDIEVAFPFYIPTIFSPNDDGINDRLEIAVSSDVEVQSYELYIFDKWGNKVFTSSSLDDSWNGGVDSNPYTSGQFVFLLKCEVFQEGSVETYSRSGSITLIR